MKMSRDDLRRAETMAKIAHKRIADSMGVSISQEKERVILETGDMYCVKCSREPSVILDSFPPKCGHCGQTLNTLDEHMASLKKSLENRGHADSKRDRKKKPEGP